MNTKLKEQILDSLRSVLPVTAIVLVLGFTITPIPMGTLGLFILGAIMLIAGMGLFTLGVDLSLTPMGSHIGSFLTQKRNLTLMIVIAFVMGFLITVAEPDLAVLAEQVPGIPNRLLIITVALGVGAFLVLGFMRIVFQKRLSFLLILCYAVIFSFGILSSKNYVPVAFDSGGVTTGPITVPFILALGVGIASVRSGKTAQDDGFGLVAFGSVGPILAVMVLGLFYPNTAEMEPIVVANPIDTREVLIMFGKALPTYLKEIAIALSPVLAVFLAFQLIFLKLSTNRLIRICVGLLYTFLGLVLFLTGVNVGFLPVGSFIGSQVGGTSFSWLLIPIGMVIGYFIVAAEPAVHVLNAQVEELTGGAISKRAMMLALSLGVACSVGLAMIRVVTGISIWWFLVPGYLIAMALTFFVPPIFTAIAFDSGGVASGAMATTFLLPFAMGACSALGGNILTDAFGAVAMVAMTPLIAIQMLGLIYNLKASTENLEENTLEGEQDELILDVE